MGANDLLDKVFPKKAGQNVWGIEVALVPNRHNKFGSKITSVGGVSQGEVSAEFALADFGVTSKVLFKTDKPTLELSWGVSDKIPVDGLSAKLHFTNDLSNQNTKLDVDAAFAHSDYKFVIGGSAKVSLPSNGDRQLDEAVVSVGYRDGKLFAPTLSYKQAGPKADRSVTGVFTSQPGDTQYVGQVDYALGSKKTTVTVGLSYPLDDGAIVKAKLNSDKVVGLGYSKQISASTKLDFGTLFQLNEGQDQKVVNAGFNFNLRFTQ